MIKKINALLANRLLNEGADECYSSPQERDEDRGKVGKFEHGLIDQCCGDEMFQRIWNDRIGAWLLVPQRLEEW